jgi:hypothetical protein
MLVDRLSCYTVLIYSQAFNIQGADVPGPFGGQFDGTLAAPSRPPSRTSNNRSPHNKIIDLTAEHAAGSYNLSSLVLHS